MNVTRTLSALLILVVVLTLHKSSVSAVFEGCDHNYKIYAGYTYSLQSDNYPSSYQPGSSCRYRYTAPKNHIIVVNCTINLDKAANGCSSESFYIALNGDAKLKGSERLCGAGTFTRSSAFQSLVLAYISDGSVGNFKCVLRTQAKPCDCGWSITRNIANGEQATINEYPSIAALKTTSPVSVLFCAGVIVSDRYLLTAAHCALYHDIGNMEAWVGLHDLESTSDTRYAKVYYIRKRIVHPAYSSTTVQNDIALLQTTTNMEFSRGVGPVCLPPYSNANNDFAWQNVEIMGWGATSFSGRPSSTLQKIAVMITDNETCQNVYNDHTILATQICTRDHLGTGKDTCQYDSGGPVIFRHKGRQYLVGVVSFGKSCAVSNDPIGVNTRVTSYLSWIYRNTGRSTCTIEM